MRRAALGLGSLAAAAAACAATWYALREATPATVRVPAPELVAAARGGAVVALAPESAPAQRDGDGVRTLEQAARDADAEEQALRDAILRVGAEEGLSLDARLARDQEAVEAARGGVPRSAVFENPSMLTEAFLRMDGVQRELAAQSPAARSEELARIRRELGFDEEQIARMQALDDWREARWQNGLLYMQERARIAATFEGDALEQELAHLRTRHFADEAPTIEREEEGGFFRFERPRVYGRN